MTAVADRDGCGEIEVVVEGVREWLNEAAAGPRAFL